MKKYILSIDQGTSSTKTIIFDESGNAVAKGHADLQTNYFDNGFVEQAPEGIYQNVLESIFLCIQDFLSKGFSIENIISVGISNQRETFILWDKAGKPLTPAVVWACKRSIEICQKLKGKNQEPFIKERTGLIIDPYFSATKLLWLLENDADLKMKLDNGEVFFGTVDCWLLWKMTNGQSFKTDFTNAHRTLLFNIHTLTWDKEILQLWGLEKLNLPEVCASSSDFGFWVLDLSNLDSIHFPKSKIPIQAMIGDSHAATFGEGCFEQGTAKVTMGTGSSIMMNIGDKPVLSNNGMLTTICWSTENRIDFAFEGAIVACGSTIEWVKNELGFFKEVAETEAMALSVSDNAGVYLIPAFSGLGAPHWQMNRRASIEGMTFGTSKNHIVRAALESIPYQIKDVINAMQNDMDSKLKSISVNGGLTRNQFVIRFLVDLLGLPLKKQQNPDVSALGAAYLAGLKSGIYESISQLKMLNQAKTEEILPDLGNHLVKKGYEGWIQKIQN
ncbi:Carbohydrate kinase, FGGY [Emticicia oligotrophica DSM 17448]|uniref:ATP:glycerol 3-phosphotransferase n=1 Tax=Emticicia oligotrophica (strain DSM 17448 / CIP 109782 / MTCC 6937 / GPTSA100-15) TaxID=929562 RepID=A0ABM5MX94_EMTOG|nr:glycerol kinase GlpK [Emticicia oligotrophica]AFK01757.1 Carbohydrate kinase, FGGY [Emticicia oligotrophica DSM 17448]